MRYTTNYLKHTSKNPLQRYLIDRYYEKVISICSKIKVNKILFAGCGEGFTMERFRLAKIGKELVGIDNSSLALKIGNKVHPQVSITKGDIFKLPFKDNSFDLVECSQVLEHMDKPLAAINHLARVSSRYCLISVPNEPIFRAANFLRGKYMSEFGNSPGHINHWTSGEMAKILKMYGFKIKVIANPFPWSIFLVEK